MHSTADIARRLGCTVQAVSKYRRKIEKQTGKPMGTPDPSDGRRTLFTDGEVAAIAAMVPQIPVSESVEAELIDGEDASYAAPITSSLALRHSTLPAVSRHSFDLATAQAETAAIAQHSARVAARGTAMISPHLSRAMGGEYIWASAQCGHLLAVHYDAEANVYTPWVHVPDPWVTAEPMPPCDSLDAAIAAAQQEAAARLTEAQLYAAVGR